MTGPASAQFDWFIDLIRVETRLYNAASARMQAEHSLTLGSYQFLQIVRDHGSCRVYDLARETAITVGAASKSVDRLEAAGWVRRTPNPDDRRSSLIALTEAGEKILTAARPTLEAELTARLARVVPTRDLERIAVTLATLRRSLEADGRGEPS